MSPLPTPSQTVGPYFSIGLPDITPQLVAPEDPDAIRVFGYVYDGEGEPSRAPGAARPTIRGASSSSRSSRASCQVPGAGPRAPHIEVSLFARGLIKRIATRIYFPTRRTRTRPTPVLSSIEDSQERATLVAAQEDGAPRFDVDRQGDRQTAFFSV